MERPIYYYKRWEYLPDAVEDARRLVSAGKASKDTPARVGWFRNLQGVLEWHVTTGHGLTHSVIWQYQFPCELD